MKSPTSSAFTLAELLIALAILGVIATFTIPKVLQGQEDSRLNAVSKESIAAVSAAFQAYQQTQPVTDGFAVWELVPYINYVKNDTTGALIDEVHNAGESVPCDGGADCLRLHNGAVLMFFGNTLSGTTRTHAVYFNLDPDGRYCGSIDCPGKSLQVFLYANGRISTRGEILAGTQNSDGAFDPIDWVMPPWFHWD